MEPAARTPSSPSGPDDASACPPADGRREARSNIFVVATIYSEAGSGPVRIRNLSHGGALVEGAVIPSEHSAVRLDRGSVSVSGHVAWQVGNRAGLRFDSAVSVPEWLPGGTRETGQQRVDEIVHTYKSGKGATSPSPPAPIPGESDLPADFADLHRALTRIAEEFAEDPVICTRHPTALQTIDVAAQTFAKFAAKFSR
jgi:hypothetical protein